MEVGTSTEYHAQQPDRVWDRGRIVLRTLHLVCVAALIVAIFAGRAWTLPELALGQIACSLARAGYWRVTRWLEKLAEWSSEEQYPGEFVDEAIRGAGFTVILLIMLCGASLVPLLLASLTLGLLVSRMFDQKPRPRLCPVGDEAY